MMGKCLLPDSEGDSVDADVEITRSSQESLQDVDVLKV